VKLNISTGSVKVSVAVSPGESVTRWKAFSSWNGAPGWRPYPYVNLHHFAAAAFAAVGDIHTQGHSPCNINLI
jgi:hypothetical protein